MSRCILNLALGLFLCAAPGLAGDDGIPLAVTTGASPSMRVTPTSAMILKSDEYLKAGLQLLDAQNYPRAVAELEDSVRLAPRAANLKALGTAYYDLGDKARAASAYRDSLELEADPQVSALVDNLEGRQDTSGQFANKADELRYDRLMKDGAAFEKKGKPDTAFKNYLQAYQIKPDAVSREKLGALGIRLAEEHLGAKSYDTAAGYTGKLRGIYSRAKDLSKKEFGILQRLDKVEQTLAEGAGDKGRKMEKALETERERKGKGPKKFKVQAEGEY